MKKIIIYGVVFCIIISAIVVVSSMSVSAGAAKPDLKIVSAKVTENTGSKITYSYTIQNVGDATIQNLYNVSIQNFYSVDTVFNDDDDKAAGGKILGVKKSLAPGEKYTSTFYTITKKPSKMNYLTFKIDWSNSVSESNENNNTKALSLKPDLKFTNITITSKTSTQIEYEYTIKNVGGAPVSSLYNVSIQNYFSKDTIFRNNDDKAAGGSIIGVKQSLNPNKTYKGTYHAVGQRPTGMIYLTCKIDYNNSISEANENNNTFSLGI